MLITIICVKKIMKNKKQKRSWQLWGYEKVDDDFLDD